MNHITPILQSLHWLPIKCHISYKILLLTYKALNGLAPAYCTARPDIAKLDVFLGQHILLTLEQPFNPKI